MQEPKGPRPPDVGSSPAADQARTTDAGGYLLALLVLQALTLISVRQLIMVHLLAGLAVLGVVVVKLVSVGNRFVRYYAGDAAYRAAGPPRPLPRALAPFLVVATLALLGSGVATLVLGIDARMSRLHTVSFLVWLPLITAHVLCYARELPRRRRSGSDRGGPAAPA